MSWGFWVRVAVLVRTLRSVQLPDDPAGFAQLPCKAHGRYSKTMTPDPSFSVPRHASQLHWRSHDAAVHPAAVFAALQELCTRVRRQWQGWQLSLWRRTAAQQSASVCRRCRRQRRGRRVHGRQLEHPSPPHGLFGILHVLCGVGAAAYTGGSALLLPDFGPGGKRAPYSGALGGWDGSGRVVPSCVPALHGMLRKGRCSSISPGKCWLQLERTVLNGPCRRTCTRSSGRCTACGWRRGSTQVGLILPQGSLQELCFIDSVGRAACSTAAAKLAHCPSASPAGPLPKSNLPSMLLVAAAPSLLTHYCAHLRCCTLKSVLVKHPQCLQSCA